MSSIWIVSMLVQWLVIALLCALVLSMLRHIGKLNVKLNALKESAEDAPKLYSKLAAHELKLVDGRPFTVGGVRNKPSLIVFFSPSCGACEALPPAIQRIDLEQDEVDVLAVPYVDRVGLPKYVEETSLRSARVVSKDDFPEEYIPQNGVPFAVALTAQGQVAARGKPKSLEHLREMAHAARHAAELATTHSARDHEWGQSIPYWQLNAR